VENITNNIFGNILAHLTSTMNSTYTATISSPVPENRRTVVKSYPGYWRELSPLPRW